MFFRRVLTKDEDFAWELYALGIIEVTTDTLYECCKRGTSFTFDIVESILELYDEVPVGYWKRDLSTCLYVLMYNPWSPRLEKIANTLVERGANIIVYFV